MPAKKVKRPRRGEANHILDIPTGDCPDRLDNERLSLPSEVKIQNNHAVTERRTDTPLTEQAGDGSGVEELKERQPAMLVDEVRNFLIKDKTKWRPAN